MVFYMPELLPYIRVRIVLILTLDPKTHQKHETSPSTLAYMEIKGIKYAFKAPPWQYKGTNGWIFISLPKTIAKEIRDNLKNEEEGWGRLKVTAKIGKTEWKTAIWFDTKMNTYLLPLKAGIRQKEKIQLEKLTAATIWV